MTTHTNPSTVQQDVESANSPEVIELRDANNEVPVEVSAYDIAKAVLSETAAAAAEVRLQSYDNDGAMVENEVVYNVGAGETAEPGSGSDDAVLTVRRGNQIRVSTTSDVEVTLYLAADDL